MSRRKPKKSSFNPSRLNNKITKKKRGKRDGRKLSKTKQTSLNTPDGLASAVLYVFIKNPSKIMNYKEVSREIRVGNKMDRERIQLILQNLVTQNKLEELSRGKFKLNLQGKTLEGTVDSTKRGGAYIISADRDEDIYVNAKNMNKAMHEDTVGVKIIYRRGKEEGIITKIIKRARTQFIGTLQMNNKFGFLVPDNDKIAVDLYIPKTKLKGAKNGEKVIGEITDWPSDSKNPFGKIIEVLGDAGNNEVVMHSILFEYDLPYEFPAEVEAIAEKINFELDSEEIKKRRDMRDVLTFTIDPHDAKDFDDALSFQVLPNGNYEIGIHIADVSFYMEPGSILDEEAYNRATSVYLVDRVVPMLPEKLSNGVCSLRPNEDKFTFSAVFEIDSNGKIKQEWFGRTVIYSDRRFTYEEAQEIIETGEGELHKEIGIMNQIAKKLRKKRFRAGAVSFDRIEVKFELNKEDNATPIGVYFKEAKDSNKLIEEYMLLANRKVAQYIGNKQNNKKPKTFIYRIHDKPKPDKFEQFANFIVQFGLNVERGENANISKSLNQVLDAVKGKKEGNMIQTLAVRTMAKAEYSTNNIGHYGLSFDYYSHFTSPIRRYPDVMVHRLLQHYLDGGETADENEYEEKCIHSSKMEKQASDAERDSIKYKQVEFMSKHLGERFKAIISGVTDWGIYAEIQENLCEGMISIRNLTDDSYFLDADNYCIVGQNTGNKYQMGDEVLVEIKNADLFKKQLDFILVDSLEKPKPDYGKEWDFEI